MATLIDASVWIDFARTRSPRTLKEFLAPHVLDPEAHVAEPIVFEVLRYAAPSEARLLNQQFETYPLLPTPADLWSAATLLGQQCRRNGITAGSVDLLIATVAIAAGATLVTLDRDYQHIARVSDLSVELLRRPS